MSERGDPALRVLLLGQPVGQARGRAVPTARGIRVMDPERSKTWKRTAAVLMQSAARRARWGVAQGPVAIEVDAVFQRPRSLRSAPKTRLWRPSTPDGDNLLKALQDAGNGVLWRDDALVVDARVRKWYAAPGEPPCVELEVWEV